MRRKDVSCDRIDEMITWDTSFFDWPSADRQLFSWCMQCVWKFAGPSWVNGSWLRRWSCSDSASQLSLKPVSITFCRSAGFKWTRCAWYHRYAENFSTFQLDMEEKNALLPQLSASSGLSTDQVLTNDFWKVSSCNALSSLTLWT